MDYKQLETLVNLRNLGEITNEEFEKEKAALKAVLILLGIIFPLLGTFKAKKGIFWKYPLSIAFFDVDIKIKAANNPAV